MAIRRGFGRARHALIALDLGCAAVRAFPSQTGEERIRMSYVESAPSLAKKLQDVLHLETVIIAVALSQLRLDRGPPSACAPTLARAIGRERATQARTSAAYKFAKNCAVIPMRIT